MITLALLVATTLSSTPTTQELESFGQEVAADFMAGKDGVSPRLDFEALFARALAGLEASAEFKQGMLKGYQAKSSEAWSALATTLGKGSVRFTKVTTTDEQPAVQLRILFDGGAFNFIELLVRKRPKSGLRIIDIYELSSGMLRSEQIRMIAAPILGEMKQGLFDRIMGKQPLLTKHLPTIQKLRELSNKQSGPNALALYRSLPPEIQRERLVLASLVEALPPDDPEYEKALGQYLTLYPDDPAAQVMGIDYHFVRQDWPGCLKAIAAVEKRAGADAWFSILRAGVATSQKNWAQAREQLDQAIAREPTLSSPYYSYIDVTIAEKKWAETVKWLDATEKALNVVFTIDAATQGFEDFAASKEGKAWLKKHSKRQP